LQEKANDTTITADPGKFVFDSTEDIDPDAVTDRIIEVNIQLFQFTDLNAYKECI